MTKNHPKELPIPVQLTAQELQKQKDHSGDLLRLRKFRPIDDTFMRILFRSVLDVENLNTRQQFDELPTTYILFITENDFFKTGAAIYPVKRINMTTGKPFNDRLQILYVNAAYKGEDSLGRLMHDFLCSDPDEMLTPLLAEKTRFYKTDPKGVDIMCKVMDELRQEAYQRGHDQGFEQGMEQGVERNTIESIKNIMNGLAYTASQAMNLLRIPPAEQDKYKNLL